MANSKNKENVGLTKEHLDVLFDNFGHCNFRPKQWDIIRTSLIDKRDQCVIMATGYGKSLCFQYPSVYLNTCTIVISPLISLMEDQVLSLFISGIPACYLGSAQTQSAFVMEHILKNEYRLIYCSPEFCTADFGLEFLETVKNKIEITMIAIDEAHCISKWGHDFRPAFKSLNKLRTLFPNVPFLAVTATATPQVQEDICKSLKMKNPVCIRTSFNRENLYFEVQSTNGKSVFDNVKPYLEKFNDSSIIIYALTKKETENITEILKLKGYSCETYHAGMTVKKRKEVHQRFVNNQIKIVVATVAFGMGIDKPDIRLVIHYGASKDLESYYQEVGRAGRDGGKSTCVTFYSSKDFVTHSLLRKSAPGGSYSKHLEELSNKMKNYLYSTECRRRIILAYFENVDINHLKLESQDSCCDNCTKNKKFSTISSNYEGLNQEGNYDFTKDSELMLNAINSLKGKYGMSLYIQFIRGQNTQKILPYMRSNSFYGAGKEKSTDWWKAIARILESKGLLGKTQYESAYTIHVSNKGEQFLKDLKNEGKNSKMMIMKPPHDILTLLKKKIPDRIPSTSGLSYSPQTKEKSDDELKFEHDLFNELKNLRDQMAQENSCPPYMVATDNSLKEMSEVRPMNKDQFTRANFNNFNIIKINKFGGKFIEFIRDFSERHNMLKTSFTSIKEALHDNPLPKKTNFNETHIITFEKFKNGNTIEAIAKERQLAMSTISSHLSAALTVGMPILLSELIQSRETIEKILKAYASFKSISVFDIKLGMLKDKLIDVDWEPIRHVQTYLQIREHLKSLNIDYKDHDPEPYNTYLDLIKPKSATVVKLGSNQEKRFKIESDSDEETSSKKVNLNDSLDDDIENAALAKMLDELENDDENKPEDKLNVSDIETRYLLKKFEELKSGANDSSVNLVNDSVDEENRVVGEKFKGGLNWDEREKKIPKFLNDF